MLIQRRTFLAVSASVAALAACGGAKSEGEKLSSLLDRLATDLLRESPQNATDLAVSEERAGGAYGDKLDDYSPEGVQRIKSVYEAGVADLNGLDRAQLSPSEAISLDVVRTAFEVELGALAFAPPAHRPYAVSQLTGAYSDIPDFLASRHPVNSRNDIEAYMARLSAFRRALDQESAQIGPDSEAGYTAPDFAIDKAIAQLNGFAQLRPAETVLVSSLRRRMSEIEGLSSAEQTAFLGQAETIVRDEVLPAFARQIEALRAVRPSATHDAGCWRLPDGEARYAAALRRHTTTQFSADEIHEMGVDVLAQVQSEMDRILRAQGMTRGSVSARMQALAERPDQLYADSDAGRAELLADLNTQMADISARMPEYFGTQARAALEIKRIPEYTEAGAPGGYYNVAALDGSRPGAFYINLRNIAEWPRFKLPTLTYHEGTPGHHWQISIAQESEGLPFIRSALLFFNAYVEGWALYAEQLADEIGVYADDPFGRLGYLQSAAFRASRLVVDTGIHAKRWSREEAIQSMLAATGNEPMSVAREVERYSVWPGQACGYMVGREAILRMRLEAQQALGERFDLKGFHDALLTSGSTPLSVTEGIVRDWVASQSV